MGNAPSTTARLEIKIVCATGLPLRSGGSQPYVLLSVDESTFETRPAIEGTSPRWDQSFTVTVANSSKISFGVFNLRENSNDDHGYLGGFWFKAESFIDFGKSGHKTVTLNLEKAKSSGNHGNLTIELSWWS